MLRNAKLRVLAVLATGAALGYCAAAGKVTPSAPADADRGAATSAVEPANPGRPCCSGNIDRAHLLAQAEREQEPADAARAAKVKGKKPNILFIMTDDVGWGDLGCFGGGEMRGAPTPHLDQMAAEGMRFVNYYGQASCTAGRASFMTGCIPIRTALSLVLVPGTPDGLTRETPTVAECLKKAGYSTVQLGKWHLGDTPESYPTANGFDEMYHMLPYYAGVYAYDDPELNPAWPKNDTKFQEMWKRFNLGEWEQRPGGKPTKVRDFGYKDMAESDAEIRKTAVKWIKDHAGDDKPFFMYLNFMKVHQPNFPSAAWKGKSPGMHPYLDSLMELDDNCGKVILAVTRGSSTTSSSTGRRRPRAA
jgi:arylsulfatase